MANYELYQSDNVTPIAIAQPLGATWERPVLDRRGNGAARRTRFARVVWTFAQISKAQHAVFVANRPDDGAMQFKTYREAVGGSPAAYVQCAGLMDPLTTGVEKDDGMIHDFAVTWTMVEEV